MKASNYLCCILLLTPATALASDMGSIFYLATIPLSILFLVIAITIALRQNKKSGLFAVLGLGLVTLLMMLFMTGHTYTRTDAFGMQVALCIGFIIPITIWLVRDKYEEKSDQTVEEKGQN